jgi:hypothetical protein
MDGHRERIGGDAESDRWNRLDVLGAYRLVIGSVFHGIVMGKPQ